MDDQQQSWHSGVQEYDGNFFENFTALSWKQENDRLRATREDEKDTDKPPPSELQFIPRIKPKPLHRKEFELLYVEVLYTVKHKIGITSGSHSPYIQDLYQYAKEAFAITPEDHARLLARASEEKPPILILNVTVIEARGLEAKDADGYSDPYCMLGINPEKASPVFEDSGVPSSDDELPRGNQLGKKGPLRRFSASFRKKKLESAVVKDLLPARLIRTTDVRPNTLNPVWNEKFRFDLGDVHSERLHLDIWDHDDESSVFDAAKKLNEVSSLRGLGRYFKQVAQSARTRRSSGSSVSNVDDFLGSVDIPLDDIPSTGTDIWLPLEARSSRSNVQGEIHLKMSLATREDRGVAEDDNWTDVRQHEDLMYIFIDHERRHFKGEPYQWTGQLPQVANTILHQHAIQGDITDVQRNVVQWIAYSRKHIELPLDYKFLLTLLEEIDKNWKPDSLSLDEENTLAESFTLFIEFSMNIIQRHRDIFPSGNKVAMTRLDTLLRILTYIHKMKIYSHVCPFHKDLSAEITSSLKKGTLEWYERFLTNSNARKSLCDKESIQSIIDLTNMINIEIYRAYNHFNKLFQEITKVKYFQTIFLQLEKLLSGDVNRILEDELGGKKKGAFGLLVQETDMVGTLAVQNSALLFEMYLGIQEFCKYKEHIQHSDWKSLSIVQFYEWFKGPIQMWLDLAKSRMISRVKKALELDKVTKTESVKYSTSSVDISSCFKQLVEFWKHLSWPDPVGTFTFVSQIVEMISQSSTLYADLIHDRLKETGYYDDEGQFDVTEQLCITINNIEQVRLCLPPLRDSLNFAEIERMMEKTYGEKGARQCKTKLDGLVKETDDEMVQKIKDVVDRVADKMRPDIKKDVFHLNWSPQSVPAEEALANLMEYLDSNLLTLNSHLLQANFKRILESIWIEVLEEFKDVLDTEDENISLYQRMFDSLDLLVEFFHADQKGLPMSTIKGDQFQMLKNQLMLRRMDTNQLIELFYNERLEQQNITEKSVFGSISVRAWYKRDSQILNVEVLNAKDIIPLDSNGLSDPFVLVQLCPEHTFYNVSVHTTKVVKKCLNPVFEESFEFIVSQEQCLSNGATILFTVMDHDIMFQNDFAGEAFLATCNVSGINGEEISGYDALYETVLPLLQPKHKKRGAFSVLLSRTNDKDAIEFTRKRSKTEEQAVDVPRKS